MSQLIDSLITNKITLNEFRLWFELQTIDGNVLENTSKYELITYLLSNIRLSTDWLSHTTSDTRLDSRVQSITKLVSNESTITDNRNANKVFDVRCDANTVYANHRKSSNIKTTQKSLTVKKLTERVQTIDLNDENVFPVLCSATDGQKCAPNEGLPLNTNNPVISRRTKRIKPTAIRADDRISVGFLTSNVCKNGSRIQSIVCKELVKTNDNFVSNGFDSIVDRKLNNRPNDSLLAEREWLKKAKANEKFPKVGLKAKDQTISSVANELPIRSESNRLVAIEANHNLVTFSAELDLISSIYAIILNLNFVPNFLDELKLICHLMAKRVYKERNEDFKHRFDQYFSSYHNCVYFSVKCLNRLLITNGLVRCLNKTVLKFITDSTVLSEFDPILQQTLETVIESEQKNVIKRSETTFITTLESVLFQSETDNKSHFPNDNSFHVFRRQRDEFYLIFNTYRNKNIAKETNLRFGNNVKHLLSLSTDSANLWHLSRLFVSQLLQTCVYKHLKCAHNLQTSDSEPTTDETVGQLSVDRDRLKKLQKRFHQPNSGPNGRQSNADVFAKDEHFFRDFILYGDSHAFNENLKLLLCDKILDLNRNQNVFNNDFESDLGEDALRLTDEFRNNLQTLRMLSKFLGFTNFYPFDTHLSNSSTVHDLIDSQSRLRCLQTKPSIDFELCLRTAIYDQKLLMTIPWIVEFLSFIDPISARIVYYENVYNLLVVIYRNFVPKLIRLVPENGFFLLFCLTKTVSNKNFNHSNRFYKTVFNAMFAENTSKTMSSSKQVLDSTNGLVDRQLVNDFYPQLNSELIEIYKQSVASNEVKKITPLTTPLLDSTKQLSNNSHTIEVNVEKQLRLQVEEQFFNSHSPSLKKTVDFLAERITSKCIRRIKTEVFIASKQPFIDSNVINNNGIEMDFNCVTNAIRNDCIAFVNDYCVQQIQSIFPLLINEDIDESVADFAAKITIKSTIDKCLDWIHKNITQTLIESDVKSELKKIESNSSKTSEPTVDYGSEVIDISPTFNAIRNLMSDLYSNQSLVIESLVIVNVINDLSHLRRSKSLPKRTVDFIDVNVMDFLMALIAKQPKLIDDSILKEFIHYWLEFSVLVERFLCPRNVYILSEQSKCSLQSWNKYETILLKMLSNGIINEQIIETDSLWTLKQEWSDSVLNRLASCLKSVFECQKMRPKSDNQKDLSANQTIDWLSWFCTQSDQ